MSNSDIEQTGTVKGHIPNRANLSGRISNVVSLSGNISIGSVASDFAIKMTLASGDDGSYTLASCDATIEQIDAAVTEMFNSLPDISTSTTRTIKLNYTPAVSEGIPEATLAIATNKGWTVVTA